jgi:hypothetical protein
VISRKKNIYRGILISSLAVWNHAMPDTAENPSTGLSPRARRNIAVVLAESQVR